MTSPTVLAMADQTMMALNEAMRLAPDNGQLHEHPILSGIITSCLGRPEMGEDPVMPGAARLGPQPKLVYPDMMSMGTAQGDPAMLDTYDANPCSICYRAHYADGTMPLSLRDNTTRRLWVNAGLTIFEFYFCVYHQIVLEEDYAPIVWKQD